MTKEAVLKELKFERLDPTAKRILVKLLPEPETTPGGIFIPAKVRDVWHKMADMTKRFLTAEVLSVGPQVKNGVKAGDIVMFQRAFFVWLYKLPSDKTLVGLISDHEIIGTVELP